MLVNNDVSCCSNRVVKKCLKKVLFFLKNTWRLKKRRKENIQHLIFFIICNPAYLTIFFVLIFFCAINPTILCWMWLLHRYPVVLLLTEFILKKLLKGYWIILEKNVILSLSLSLYYITWNDVSKESTIAYNVGNIMLWKANCR